MHPSPRGRLVGFVTVFAMLAGFGCAQPETEAARRVSAVPSPTPVPTPEPVRVQAAAVRPGSMRPIGRIEIPAIGLSHDVYEGIELRVINRGPGRHTDTAMPGHHGNTTFAGHRTTYGRPFRNIDRLQPGDRIVFHMPYGTHTYEVYESFVVRPHEVWVTHPTDESIVTLYACHPPGSASYRYVVRGRLVPAAIDSGTVMLQ